MMIPLSQILFNNNAFKEFQELITEMEGLAFCWEPLIWNELKW